MIACRHGACALLAGLLLALVHVACGGDDDDDEAAGTATADTTAVAANERLDQETWDAYVEQRDEARAVNDEAITTFRRCRDLLGTDVPAERVEECLGSATTDVVTEGQEVLAELDDLAGDVSGACADANEQLSGNIKLYIASVNAIGRGVEQGNLPSSNDVGSSLAQLERSRTAAAAFERACKPV